MTLELVEFLHEPRRGVAGLLAEPLPPGLRRRGHITAREHPMGHVHRAQRPGDAVVLSLHPQVVEQDVEAFATVGLCGGRVPVAILCVVFRDAFQHQPQAGRRLLHRQRTRDEVLDEPGRMAVGRCLGLPGLCGPREEVFEPVPHAAPQDPAER